jgi:hypothetical protein
MNNLFQKWKILKILWKTSTKRSIRKWKIKKLRKWKRRSIQVEEDYFNNILKEASENRKEYFNFNDTQQDHDK